ncbi:MAG: heavy metal translocating P-type ATPase [Steroidobacteraceae bacterium]
MSDSDDCGGDAPSSAPTGSALDTTPGRAAYRIENMDCPTDEALIRAKLSRLQGVQSLEFHLMQRTLVVSHTLSSLAPLEQALTAIGMRASLLPETREDSTVRDQADQSGAGEEPTVETHWGPLIVSGIAALAAEIVYWLNDGNHWAVVVLALVSVFTGGLPTYKKGWIALKNRNLNMNALMSIAVTGAMLIGQWPEAAMVMFLFALAEVIEAKSLDRARNAIRGLMDLAPDTATVKQPDGAWTEIDAKTVPLNAIVRVRPGERMALDGRIVAGRSTVNQAPITGESLPVEKAEGDPVFAGTINEFGSFEYQVTARATDSTLARIMHAVEAAQGTRAPTQRFVDKFARVYTPAVFAVALLVMILPPLLLGGAWFEWIYRALVLLVIACPCALVISTPVTIVSGLAAAARKGILIKGGVYLEEGKRLVTLALDKTGTITHGKPALTDFAVLDDGLSEASPRITASLASRSDHPVSLAITKAMQADGVALDAVDGFEALPGRGVAGRVNGVAYILGNHRLMEERGLCSKELEARLDAFERQGKTVVLLASNARVHALFAVADTVKESSRQAVADLQMLGIRMVMLTGDNEHTAEAIATQVGIDEVRGNLLPEDKLTTIGRLASHGAVGMVGDGINDAPALARADIGFAMGAAGTDTAIETADVALMDDDLRKIPSFIRLSRMTAAVLKQNITLALGVKAVFLGLTVVGMATMWMAVFADMGASLLVVFNGLRLLRS